MSSRKGAWTRSVRKIFDSKSSQQLSQPKKQSAFAEIEIFGATKAKYALRGNGEFLRTRQEAANLFSAAVREAKVACPL